MMIDDKSVIKILEKKYLYEIDAYENKKISIFKNWIRLFDSLCKLEESWQNHQTINDDEFLNSLANSMDERELFMRLWDKHQAIFVYKNTINFKLFKVYKRALEIYDQNEQGVGENKFLRVLENYAMLKGRFPVQQCLKFYTIFSEQLKLNARQPLPSYIERNHQQLNDAQYDVSRLFLQYGSLYTFNITYQFRKIEGEILSNRMDQQFELAHLIEKKIVSDRRLLKVFFKFEDDGVQGFLLNCILIYSKQHFSNPNQCLNWLEEIPNMFNKFVKVEFKNWGKTLNQVAGTEVIGWVENNTQLESFLYWTIGSFYRHEDFFHYQKLWQDDVEFQHEQVSTPWMLGGEKSKAGAVPKITQVKLTEWSRYISNSEDVWSIQVLPKSDQKKLMIDKIVLSEIHYDLVPEKKISNEVYYFLQVFYTFLSLGTEPFFILDSTKNLIEPRRLGRQLFYVFNVFCQRPNLLNDLKELDLMLGFRLGAFLNGQLCVALVELSKQGIHAFADNLQNFNQLRDHYLPSQFSARLPSFENVHVENSTYNDLTVFDRRTKTAKEYFKKVFQRDRLVCRINFYAEVEGETFIVQRNFFSEHFSEFLRTQQKSNGALNHLNSYFLIWLGEPQAQSSEKKKIVPYVEVVFIFNYTYGDDFERMIEAISNAWRKFEGKQTADIENRMHFRTSGFECKKLMHSDELLNSYFVITEKKNKKLIHTLFEKLLPYFTYRHFYLPKLYDDLEHKKVKMFTKGGDPEL